MIRPPKRIRKPLPVFRIPRVLRTKIGAPITGYGLQITILALLLPTLLLACTQTLPDSSAAPPPRQAAIVADGESRTVTSEASNVRELLEENNVTLGEADEIDPPPFTPLEDGMTVTIVRVTESVEVIPQSVPFTRKIVRSDAMEADDPPRIVQPGKDGLQEITIRIVYRDGLEEERWPTQVTVVEPAQDEIVMVGIGSTYSNVEFGGILAYISDGTPIVLKGSTRFPEQLNTGGPLDGRVFSLSPTGSHLLFTRVNDDDTAFNNSLWIVETRRGARPRSLEVNNVLWAGWDPSAVAAPQIAYTTAISTSLPPGWEANNDLWLGEVPLADGDTFAPEQLIEAYPATYGWWGGHYSWSPNGRYLAYSYANEVGLIDTEAAEPETRRVELHRFTEYQTLADWVWVPTMSWSPDGRYLAFTSHGSDDAEAMQFDSWAVDTQTNLTARFVEQSGMWGHLHWSPAGLAAPENSHIAYLQANNPIDSLRSTYTLWLMDEDGSNARQIYPAPGENSYFPADQHFMAWGPTGRDIAFIFDDALHILNLDTVGIGGAPETFQVTQNDAVNSHPSWAPYGRAVTDDLTYTRFDNSPPPEDGRSAPIDEDPIPVE